MRKRPIEVKFRLSLAEYELLQQKLIESGMNRNAFLVRLISDAQIYPRDLLMELCLEYQIMNRLVRGIGTNINQLAKVANATKNTPSAHFLMDMHQEMKNRREKHFPLT